MNRNIVKSWLAIKISSFHPCPASSQLGIKSRNTPAVSLVLEFYPPGSLIISFLSWFCLIILADPTMIAAKSPPMQDTHSKIPSVELADAKLQLDIQQDLCWTIPHWGFFCCNSPLMQQLTRLKSLYGSRPHQRDIDRTIVFLYAPFLMLLV